MEGTGNVAAAPGRSHMSMRVTLIAMTLANSMILVDQTAVPLATPDAILDLGGSLSESQWLLTANVLPLAAFMVLGGRLGDLVGLRRIFLTEKLPALRRRGTSCTSCRSRTSTGRCGQSCRGLTSRRSPGSRWTRHCRRTRRRRRLQGRGP